MYIYYICMIFIIFFGIIFLFKRNVVSRDRKMFVVLSFFLMFLIQSFRSIYVGSDLSAYLYNYSIEGGLSWTDIFYNYSEYSRNNEIGFLIYQKIVFVLFNGNQQAFVAVTAFIILTSICCFIYRYSPNVFLPTYMFMTMGLYAMTFTGLRQSMAIAIAIWGFSFVRKRKIIPFALIIALATIFHYSAIFCFSIYFLYKLRLTRKIFASMILGIFVVLLMRVEVFQFIIKYIYGNYELVKSSRYITTTFLMFFILYILVYLRGWRKEMDLDQNCNYVLAGFYVSIFALSSLSPVLSRSAMYFTLYFYFAIETTVKSLKPVERIFIVSCLCILCSLVFPIFCERMQIDDYTFFWQVF